MCQQKMSEEASLREEKACPDCPMTKNRPEMGLERLVELSTISNGCTAFLDQLCRSDPRVATAFSLAQTFGQLLRKREGKPRLAYWEAAVRASGITELIDFVDGLAEDAEAVANGCTESWSNGMVEGFINKVKWIKRSSYGQAGFPLLQRRVLLHLAEKSAA